MQKAKSKVFVLFIFTMYGVSKSKNQLLKTPTDPQTIYAKSKVSAEKSISKLADKNFAQSC